MKQQLKSIVISTLLVFCALTARADDPKSAVIGFVPSENPETLQKHGIELAKKIQDKMGVAISIYIPKNYTGLVEAMKEKKVDFAFFTAATFIFAEQSAGAKPLLKKVWNNPFYFSAIVTLKKSGIKSIKDLKGKKFGFVDEKSTSGFLYPKAHLLKNNADPAKFFSEQKFFGNHEATVKALLNKEVDAIAVYGDDEKGTKGAWVDFAKNNKGQFKVLWVSDPIPNDPFCVRKDFYEKYPRFSHDLMFTLIDMADSPDAESPLQKLLGVKGLTTATTRQYDPVRDLVKSLNLKLQ